MGTTTLFGLRYPDPTATVDVARDIKNLADDTNTGLTMGVMRFATKAARDAALVGALAPLPGMMAYTADSDYTEQYLTIGAWSGWAPLPGSFVADFSMSAAQSVANDSWAGVAWQTTAFDRLAAMNANRMQYNPKVAGRYTCVAYANFAGAPAGTRSVRFMLNGAYYGMTPALPGSSASSSTAIATVNISLNGSTDNIQIVVYQNSGAALALDNGSSRFMITYAGP